YEYLTRRPAEKPHGAVPDSGMGVAESDTRRLPSPPLPLPQFNGDILPALFGGRAAVAVFRVAAADSAGPFPNFSPCATDSDSPWKSTISSSSAPAPQDSAQGSRRP